MKPTPDSKQRSNRHARQALELVGASRLAWKGDTWLSLSSLKKADEMPGRFLSKESPICFRSSRLGIPARKGFAG